jgi:hypothetical protein
MATMQIFKVMFEKYDSDHTCKHIKIRSIIMIDDDDDDDDGNEYVICCDM